MHEAHVGAQGLGSRGDAQLRVPLDAPRDTAQRVVANAPLAVPATKRFMYRRFGSHDDAFPIRAPVPPYSADRPARIGTTPWNPPTWRRGCWTPRNVVGHGLMQFAGQSVGPPPLRSTRACSHLASCLVIYRARVGAPWNPSRFSGGGSVAAARG